MRFDQDYVDQLLIDILAQRFDQADDIIRFLSSQTGKLDESIVMTYWFGKEYMVKDKASSDRLYYIST